MQEYTVVTVIKDNVVDRLEVFVNNEEAESHFLEECEKEVLLESLRILFIASRDILQY